MPLANFTRMLQEARRKSQLAGRPMPRQEAEGLAAGYASEAATRNALQRNLDLQQMQQEESQRQFNERLAWDKEAYEGNMEWQEHQLNRQSELQKHLQNQRMGQEMELARMQRDFQQTEFDRQYQLARQQMRWDQRMADRQGLISGVGGGAALGAYIGGGMGYGAWGGPIGAAIGAVVGFGAYLFSKGCIIVTALHGADSDQVDTARRFRDECLGPITLGGYYLIARPTVKAMEKSHLFKLMVKKFLVDRLIDYGEVHFKKRAFFRYRTSVAVTRLFLATCTTVGYMALNGGVDIRKVCNE